jgi:hypothetical protein
MSMDKSKLFRRASGFYLALLAALLCLISAVLYSVFFAGVDYTHGALFSDTVFIALIAAAVLAVAMLFVRLEGYAPVVLCLASGISLLVYIHRMVWPIADIFIAIDPVPFIPEMAICGALLLLSFVVAEVSLYRKKRREPAEAK